MQKNIVLYDDDCSLCKSIKIRIEGKNRASVFSFVSQASDIGKQYIANLSPEIREQNSLIFIDSSSAYTKSDAIIQILRKLGEYRLLYFFIHIFPKTIRNSVYDAIAWLRYRI